MHPDLAAIPDRILSTALGALRQANTQAVFADPGMEHRDYLCISSSAFAGELIIKAVIAKEHPLLIFRDLFHLEKHIREDYEFTEILLNAKTYQFDKLPELLWVTTGERIPDLDLFHRVRRARNSVQHFSAPDAGSFRRLSLEFLYKIVDPLLHRHFGLFAVDYHEDYSIGYDYVVNCLIAYELEFSVPKPLCITEFDVRHELSKSASDYRDGFGRKLLNLLDR
ncbi:hypothetical protein [Qipengyuania sp.]|uniref:hypothetical protein n=1 Tax=Qipengyuania sp. TaxID=2004515 RepID=UPI0035188359